MLNCAHSHTGQLLMEFAARPRPVTDRVPFACYEETDFIYGFSSTCYRQTPALRSWLCSPAYPNQSPAEAPHPPDLCSSGFDYLTAD
jgi:hypothetical protein